MHVPSSRRLHPSESLLHADSHPVLNTTWKGRAKTEAIAEGDREGLTQFELAQMQGLQREIRGCARTKAFFWAPKLCYRWQWLYLA